MPGSVIIRFPDGDKVFDYSERELREGSVIWHTGDRYVVVGIDDVNGGRAVRVELDASERGGLSE